MKILVVGSGGREHALVWKIAQSAKTREIWCAPGNPGIAKLAHIVPISASDIEGLARFVEEKNIDLTVVGPEQPLADGIVDYFEKRGKLIFGPTKNAAQLEWSKAFAKGFMERHKIPTARYAVFDKSQRGSAESYVRSLGDRCVLKADGLAAGKGVIVCSHEEDAIGALRSMMDGDSFGNAASSVVIEEFLEGDEASVFAVCDGRAYVTLAPAQDHKRVFDDDQGKNTGGMGAYAPAPVVTSNVMNEVRTTIIEPTLNGMRDEDRTYRGCLYVGLMITSTGPKVVEYNCRFGDPETQVVLPLYEGDLADLFLASCTESIPIDPRQRSRWRKASVCVVLSSGGYPDTYVAGKEIVGLASAEALDGIQVFHAGTREEKGKLLTAGGRVLGITSVDRNGELKEAIGRAYSAVRKIRFDRMHFRKDIGKRGIE